MLTKRTLIAACLLAGGLGAPAAASSLHHSVAAYGHGHGHGNQSCTWRGHTYAGTLVIDGCRTVIRSNCDVRATILGAFRRAGYHARYDRGSLLVSFHAARRPNIRWYGESTGARFSWGNGCVRIGLYNQACNACTGHAGDDRGQHDQRDAGRRPGRGWNDRGGRDRDPHWNRRDTRRGRPGRRGTCR